MQELEQIDERIIKLFSGEISPDEEKLLALWINESDENRKYFLELKNIWQNAQPAFNPENINTEKAHFEILKKIKTKSARKIPFFVWWQRVAAILIIPAILLVAVQYNQNSIRKSSIAYQEIMSPLGMNSKITLPDGSVVWLNSGSKLKYPVEFYADVREVQLYGEAFFKVQSDKKHPFIVSTKNLQVIATGTSFNIESYCKDSISAVTLLEGKLDVKIGEKITQHIDPNQRFLYNYNTSKYAVTKTDANHWCVWKDGILAFRDEPLEDVFKRIGRTYNVDLVVKDKTVARQLYRATFEGESLDEILRLLKMSAPIKYKRFDRELNANKEFNKEMIEVYKSPLNPPKGD